MTLVDTNVWLALALAKHSFHDAVDRWFSTCTLPRAILFCRATQLSFLRLVTTASVTRPYGGSPLSNSQAWALYERFLEDPRIGTVAEPPDLEVRWKALAIRGTASPKLWMDAYLAAFAIAAGHQLVTTDQGFEQFSGLNVLLLSKVGANDV